MSIDDRDIKAMSKELPSGAIPLFDGPSKQAAVLLLESCGINVVHSSEGFAIRRGRRGWTTKTREGNLRDAIDAYRFDGPKSVVSEFFFHLEVASALAGTDDEKPYRELAACYSDAVDMISKVKERRLREAVRCLEMYDRCPETQDRHNDVKKVIQFPNRGKT